MRLLSLVLIVVFVSFASFKQNGPLLELYNHKGKQIDLEQLVKQATEADVVLFGEHHDNPLHHWLQLELAQRLAKNQKRKLMLGAEMFETDQQLILNEYLNGFFNDSKLEEGTKLWPNYKTDYKPLLQLAKKEKLRFMATNTPRRYASMVFMKGFEALDSLSESARALLPPLPIPYDATLSTYADMVGAQMGGHSSANLPKAQALKDATMAWNIVQNHHHGSTFLHFHGNYHSLKKEGIAWYINQYNPQLKVLVISAIDGNLGQKPDDHQLAHGDVLVKTIGNFPKSH